MFVTKQPKLDCITFLLKYYGILKAERPDADKLFEEVKITTICCLHRTDDLSADDSGDYDTGDDAYDTGDDGDNAGGDADGEEDAGDKANVEEGARGNGGDVF